MNRRDRKRIEGDLRALRAEPRDEFTRALASSMRPSAAARGNLRLRVAFSGVLTVGLLAALGAVGGIGYAATAAQQAAHVVKKAFAPTGNSTAVVVRGLSADGDQYRPGFGFGDPNHNHEGPPGLKKKGEEFAPPAQTKTAGKSVLVKTSIPLDEQAILHIQVVDKNGKPVLLTQKGSVVGGKVVTKGATQVKTLTYKVLVPRTIPLSLKVPKSVLKNGPFKIKVTATDPDGNTSSLLIPLAA